MQLGMVFVIRVNAIHELRFPTVTVFLPRETVQLNTSYITQLFLGSYIDFGLFLMLI